MSANDQEFWCRNLINGKWLPSVSGKTFTSSNPAYYLQSIDTFPDSNLTDLDRAIGSAWDASRSWKLVPAPKRGEILLRAAQILQDRKESLAQLMTQEMGKILMESRGDVQEAIDMFNYYAGEGRRLFGETTPSELPNKFAMSIRMPKGVAALITPFNFPMAIPAWKLAPALVSGNTVVFKPSREVAACATALVEALLDAGLKEYPGVLNLIHGKGEKLGTYLTADPRVSVVSFTGSTETGKQVATYCAQSNKKCSLEMGGKNCTIVLEDADLDLAAESCVWGAFGTTGQRCTASSRIIVQKTVLSKFLDRFLPKVESLKVGNGLDKDVGMGPLINNAALEKVERYVEIGQKEFNQEESKSALLCGGKRLTGPNHVYGYFFEPTVFLAPDARLTINQEEIFGPVVSIIPCVDFDTAIRIANKVRYGLSTAIITQDVNKAFKAMRDLEAGITYINSSTIGAEVHLPFGGVKQTGNGNREGSKALDTFTEWKAVYVDYSGSLQKAQIDNN